MKLSAKSLGSLVFTLVASACAAQQSPPPMHEHMQHMQAGMAAIRAEQDPARRSELMRQHHASMRAGMHMIAEAPASGMTMEQRMSSMEERMRMMGMMMEQMMEVHHPDVPATASGKPDTENPDAAQPAPQHQH